MDASHRGLRRTLSVAHLGLTLGAWGIGNAAVGGAGDGVAWVHLALGVMLLVTGLGLWRGDGWVRWLALANGLVGVVVLWILHGAAQQRSEVALPLVGGAIAFVMLEVAAFAVLSEQTPALD